MKPAAPGPSGKLGKNGLFARAPFAIWSLKPSFSIPEDRQGSVFLLHQVDDGFDIFKFRIWSRLVEAGKSFCF